MIGERIKLLREKDYCSQAELANQIGISQSALGNYERGDRVPDANTLVSLAQYFKVSADYLLGLSNDPSHVPTAIDELGLSKGAISELLRIKDLGLSPFLDYFICFSEDGELQRFLVTLQELLSTIKNSKHLRYPELETDELLDDARFSEDPSHGAVWGFSKAASEIETLAKEKLGIKDARLVVENDLVDYLSYRAHLWLDDLIRFMTNDAISKE